MRAILVAVGYSDLLAVTLPYNRGHFESVLVVTAEADYESVRVIAEANDTDVVVTDRFYRKGATFNKWDSLEYGLDVMGRTGIICIMDADVLWPKTLSPGWMREVKRSGKGLLYSPLRRMMTELPVPFSIPPEREWGRFPIHRNVNEWAGYSQIFHADDPVLGPAPWHETNWKHCGGADSFFQAKWPRERKVRPPWECLHLGPAGVNWLGRTSQLLDGSIPEGTDERRLRLAEIWRLRRQNRNFDHEKI